MNSKTICQVKKWNIIDQSQVVILKNTDVIFPQTQLKLRESEAYTELWVLGLR